MAIKAIIYDLDGTLVKTKEEYQCQVVGETLRELGIEPTVDKIKRFCYGSERDHFIQNVLKIDPIKFKHLLNKYDTPEKRKKAIIAYNDVSALSFFMELGYKQAIFTGAPQNLAKVEIELIGEKHFQIVISANPEKGIPHKPNPKGLEKCLSVLGVKPEEAIYVGNGEEDVNVARNAKVLDVMIKRGEYEFPDLKPTITVYSLHEIEKYLRNLS